MLYLKGDNAKEAEESPCPGVLLGTLIRSRNREMVPTNHVPDPIGFSFISGTLSPASVGESKAV